MNKRKTLKPGEWRQQEHVTRSQLIESSGLGPAFIDNTLRCIFKDEYVFRSSPRGQKHIRVKEYARRLDRGDFNRIDKYMDPNSVI